MCASSREATSFDGSNIPVMDHPVFFHQLSLPGIELFFELRAAEAFGGEDQRVHDCLGLDAYQVDMLLLLFVAFVRKAQLPFEGEECQADHEICHQTKNADQPAIESDFAHGHSLLSFFLRRSRLRVSCDSHPRLFRCRKAATRRPYRGAELQRSRTSSAMIRPPSIRPRMWA